MRLSFIAFGALTLFSASRSFVGADQLQDEIDAATKRFCGGIDLAGPTQGQVFGNPQQVSVTVTRVENAEAKVVNGVDIFAIDENGNPRYLGTPWKGNYELKTQATLNVDITKAPGVNLPSQFEFRVWVHNQAGPDCTLRSKVFKVTSGTHTNEEMTQLNNMDSNIDRGCFGIEITKPALGEHVQRNQMFPVQVKRDPSSHVETYNNLDLYRIDLETRQPTKIQNSWQGKETVQHMFNVKDKLHSAPGDKAKGKGFAYYYKLEGVTQHTEPCEFYSHPFYID
ncbi:uncharacterized protein BYT42DRAFT_28691 [Radiomyces spectabilis]|uniref:uncharacterized protein n=1 Tax=Radiomyces spectabilis TaxID=64574 RepID=UPI0022203FE5|nr:uncharacterized protein BYT42DRAFT_28691 [Radiomyces spectabilis]KAI8394053.1 hypothetical protein BYT42DRAFT_28691 [Radiomyces spectabilis]